MDVVICRTPQDAGNYAAAKVAATLNYAVAARGNARLLLSTGRSQFETLRSLVRKEVDWGRVDGFHLDEYIGVAEDDSVSFRRYLSDRVASIVPLKMHYVDSGSRSALEELSQEVASAPMDAAIIGIGENGHLAFNDPPADFDTTDPYVEVELEQRCKEQQVREGWFESVEDVPRKAITMSVSSIMRSSMIISPVPYEVKARAVATLLTTEDVTPQFPATVLRHHANSTLVLDRESSELIPQKVWERCVVV